MPASTPIYGFPYPLGTDPVGQGAQDIQDLATAVESVLDKYAGLVKVVPTSATNGTIDARGNVSIGNSVSEVFIGGAFTSRYANYLLTISDGSYSGARANIQMQLRQGTSTPSQSTYFSQILYGSYASTALATNVNNGASWQWVGSAISTVLFSCCTIIGPALNKRTAYSAPWISDVDGGQTSGYHNTQAIYDGCRLFLTPGTMTGGVIRIYGYNQ
jgi:hypothetical protein